jgi:AbrB family looped-hinge helix DNA binding protein
MKKCDVKLCWVVTVWPKGQIVIPKEIRDGIGIESGDSMAILLNAGKYIGLVRNEDVSELMEYINNSES